MALIAAHLNAGTDRYIISLFLHLDSPVPMVSVDVRQHANNQEFRAHELCESRGGRPGLPVPNSPYGLCSRKTPLNLIKNCVRSLTGNWSVN